MTKGVAVQFLDRRGGYRGKKYTYLVDHITDVLKVGDIIEVPTRGSGHKTVRICEVDVSANNPRIHYKQARKWL